MKLEDVTQILSLAFTNAILEIFQTTVQIPVKETEDDCLPSGDMSLVSSIGITGGISGNVSVCCSKESVAKVISKMLGTEVTADSEDLKDGLAEIVNMVAGSTKNKLEVTRFLINLSIPTTLMGNQICIEKSKNTELIEKDFVNDLEGVAIKTYFAFKIVPDEEAKKAQEAIANAGNAELNEMESLMKLSEGAALAELAEETPKDDTPPPPTQPPPAS